MYRIKPTYNNTPKIPISPNKVSADDVGRDRVPVIEPKFSIRHSTTGCTYFFASRVFD